MSNKINFESLLTAETNISVYEFSSDLGGIEITYAQAAQQLDNGNLIVLFTEDGFFYPQYLSSESREVFFYSDYADYGFSLYSPTDNDYLTMEVA